MKWKYDDRARKYPNIGRLAGLVFALIVMCGSVTYAALQSQQAKLTDNLIQTATANLQIGPDGNSFGSSLNGFVFGGLIPGGGAIPQTGYSVFVKNTGNASLSLRLSVTNTPLNADNVDLDKVHVILTPKAGGSTQNFTLKSLIESAASGGLTILSPNQLLPGQISGYTLQVSMEVDAMNGTSATISGLDFSFSGSTVGP